MSEIDIKPYKDQIYDELKSKHLKLKKLFVDNEFPPDYRSLVKYKAPPSEVYWKRPNEIVNNPQFFVNGADPHDIDQGLIGDCWFIAGAIAIAAYPEYLEKVVPKNQSFSKDYCGIFHFRFWKYGQWYDVVIDDLLPVNKNNELIYCRNKRTKNEFWCSLLEKAYAKLATCYEFLNGGLTHDSMIEMTGGVNESFELNNIRFHSSERSNLWKLLNQAHLMKSLIGASIYVKRGREAILYNGLVEGHAYTVTKLVEVKENNSYYGDLSAYLDSISYTVRLIRLKNPWNNSVEWRGRFSDYSSAWNRIPNHIKEEIGLVRNDDGEFWMSFDDFMQNFNNLTIVHVDMNAFYNKEDLNRKIFKWKCRTYHGEFKPGLNSYGNGRYDRSSFFKNPQYLINIKDIDLDDNDDTATLIISLMQKESINRRVKNYGELNDEPIQFRLYKLINSYLNLDENSKFSSNDLTLIGDSGPYAPYQVVSKRFKLFPGYYVIIPSTYEPEINLKYLLRIYTEFEINDDYGFGASDFDINAPKRPSSNELEKNNQNFDNKFNYNDEEFYNDSSYNPYKKYFGLLQDDNKKMNFKHESKHLNYGWKSDIV